MNTSKREYAVFDIDGTLLRWQLLHSIFDQLYLDGYVSPKSHKEVDEQLKLWHNRHPKIQFQDFEATLVKNSIKEFKGISLVDFDQACLKTFNNYKDRSHVFTKKLINELKAKNYFLICISGSPENIIKLIANYYGFDQYSASKYSVSEGKLTGGIKVIYGSEKLISLKKIIQEFNLNDEPDSLSLAVGDTLGDVEILQHVKKQIVFNPSSDLYEVAKNNGWEIVIERKNVIYKLKNHHGTYRLLD